MSVTPEELGPARGRSRKRANTQLRDTPEGAGSSASSRHQRAVQRDLAHGRGRAVDSGACHPHGTWPMADRSHIVSFAIYGATLISLYTASSLHHSIRHVKGLEKLDHAMIYLLIAGSYTPICLVVLRGGWGWSIFGVEWALGITGLVLSLALSGARSGLDPPGHLPGDGLAHRHRDRAAARRGNGCGMALACGRRRHLHLRRCSYSQPTGHTSSRGNSTPTIFGTCSYSAAASATSS